MGHMIGNPLYQVKIRVDFSMLYQMSCDEQTSDLQYGGTFDICCEEVTPVAFLRIYKSVLFKKYSKLNYSLQSN